MMNSEKIQELPIESIRANPHQSRTVFDKDKIKVLALSIRRRGLLQPISVRFVNGEYFIIQGERRWRAHKMNGMKTIKAVVVEKEYSDEDMAIDQLVENIVREDLNVVEKANGIKALLSTVPNVKACPPGERLKACFSLVMNTKFTYDTDRPSPKPSQENYFVTDNDKSICYSYMRMIGLKYNSITMYLKILELPIDLQKKVVFGRTGKKRRGMPSSMLSLRSAYELTRLNNTKLIYKLTDRVLREHWSIHRIKAVVDTILKSKLDDINYRSKKPKSVDMGLSKLTGEIFAVAQHLISWRRLCLSRLKFIHLEIDAKAGLLQLKEQAENLLYEIDKHLDGQEVADMKRLEKTREQEFTISIGNDNRISIPASRMKAIGLPSFRSKTLRGKPISNIKIKLKILEVWN